MSAEGGWSKEYGNGTSILADKLVNANILLQYSDNTTCLNIWKLCIFSGQSVYVSLVISSDCFLEERELASLCNEDTGRFL